jgi:hypothetical protein
MSDKPEDLEDKGANLLASLPDSDPADYKIKIAPDVQPGDAVFLNGETGQYERLVPGAIQHGVFDGYDIKITVGPITFRHSPIDGVMIVDDSQQDDE